MKYFIDTEFSERGYGHPIELISIGIAAEDGRELYACNADFKPRRASQWVRENVLPLLPERHPTPPPYGSPRAWKESFAWKRYRYIGEEIREFVGDDSPEFWGYYCGFDFVILSQLMGGFEQWPKGWPFYMRDLRQWLDDRGADFVKQPDDDPHDALMDARWIRDAFTQHENSFYSYEVVSQRKVAE